MPQRYDIIMIESMISLLHLLSALTNAGHVDIARFIGLHLIHIKKNQPIYFVILTPTIPDFERV